LFYTSVFKKYYIFLIINYIQVSTMSTINKLLWTSFIQGFGQTSGSVTVIGMLYCMYKISDIYFIYKNQIKNEKDNEKENEKENETEDGENKEQSNEINSENLLEIQDIEYIFKNVEKSKERNFKRLFDKL
jgi:phosphotransferase system  glucose/maltose/N-acetylglucosamine-specific IIC component